MRVLFACLITAGIAALTCLPTVDAQGPAASWLDNPKPAGWNSPGAGIPSPPRVDGAVDPRCQSTARQPVLPEDRLVRDRGWDLAGSYQGGWPVVVIRGTAGYDGMCRPLKYQDFVFVGGVFAGTLSPHPMDSRTDGAISQVQVQGSTRVLADYTRYAVADALCCPSRITSVVFDVTAEPAVVQPSSASTADASAPVADTAPRLPTPAAPASFPPALAGTSWRLVKFEARDGTVLKPDNPSNYTLELAADGRLSLRVDCNQGRGTWTADASQITVGAVSMTRQRCAPNPLQSRMAARTSNVSQYVIRDGHLFLSTSDGSVYEYEPRGRR